jgi:predicted alpha/beta hydrolase family esterase
MQKSFLSLFTISLISMACQREPITEVEWAEKKVQIGTNKLSSYFSTNAAQQNFLIVFESGLGSGHSIWQQKGLLEQASNLGDVLLYDRAGYEHSVLSTNTPARNIENMRKDLEELINTYAAGRKVVLVGHSLGGFVIRDYAIKNPQKVAAILFVDTSHEDFLSLTQEQEDAMVSDFTNKVGTMNGATQEAKMLIEDIAYMKTLPNLPNIPICAITGLKGEIPFDATAKQALFDKHQKLRKGVTDFTHIASTASGHYIMKDDPQLIVHGLQLLMSKISPNNY